MLLAAPAHAVIAPFEMRVNPFGPTLFAAPSAKTYEVETPVTPEPVFKASSSKIVYQDIVPAGSNRGMSSFVRQALSMGAVVFGGEGKALSLYFTQGGGASFSDPDAGKKVLPTSFSLMEPERQIAEAQAMTLASDSGPFKPQDGTGLLGDGGPFFGAQANNAPPSVPLPPSVALLGVAAAGLLLGAVRRSKTRD